VTPNALSVTESGEPDGWRPQQAFRGEVGPDGTTRLCVSLPPGALPRIHRVLLDALEAPLGVLYVQRVDRAAGINHEEAGGVKRYLALEIPAERVRGAFDRCQTLLFADGRHQTWVRGRMGERLILEYDGMMYVYPDDPSFRDALIAAGVPELPDAETIGDRDYVKVQFQARADAEERILMTELNLHPYGGE